MHHPQTVTLMGSMSTSSLQGDFQTCFHVNSQAEVHKGNLLDRNLGYYLRWKEKALEVLPFVDLTWRRRLLSELAPGLEE